MKAALIGHPVAQSKSQIIHEYWLKQHNIEGRYDLIDTPPEGLEQIVRRLVEEGYNGFNITVPHKEKIVTFCDELDDGAKQIGAVNTVHVKGGKLQGYNTDVAGFMQNLKSSIPDFDATGKTALVLGAGGAARAALYGLINSDIEKIILTNRTKEKAQTLQKDFGNVIEVVDWSEKENQNLKTDLLVNTTSLGMINNPPLEFDCDGLKEGAVVYDIVYNPLHTALLKNAKSKKYQIVTGIGMLLYQAAPAFKLWSDVAPSVTPELQELVLP